MGRLKQLRCKHKRVNKFEYHERSCPGFIYTHTLRLECFDCGIQLDYDSDGEWLRAKPNLNKLKEDQL